MAPEGWREVRLGDLFESSREKGKPGLPTMSVTLNEGLVLRESLERKTDTNLAPEEHLRLRKGYLAYNMMRMWQGASGLSIGDALVSPAYVVLKPRTMVDPLFASYFFKAARTIYLFWAYSYGLTKDRLRLYFPDFSLIPAAVPPINEQRKIAEILSTWDHAIETVEKLIENSESQKQALAQRLLSGTERLKGFTDPWSEVLVKDMGDIFGGGTPDSGNTSYWDGDLLWATPSDITASNSRYIGASARRISKLGLENSAARLLPKGSLLICSRATIGDIAIAAKPIATNQGFKNLVPNPNHNVDFLYYLFTWNKHILKRYACGSTFLELSKRDFEKRVFLVPPLNEQRAIAEVLNKASEEISVLEHQFEILKREKTALMQHLLTGKRRVKVDGDVERIVSERVAHG